MNEEHEFHIKKLDLQDELDAMSAMNNIFKHYNLRDVVICKLLSNYLYCLIKEMKEKDDLRG